MRYRPSDLVPRSQRTSLLTLLVDIAALVLVGGAFSTQGFWFLFLKPTPEVTPDVKPDTPGEQRAPAVARTYLKLPDMKTQMQGLAVLIQEGQPNASTPLLLGAILTEIADAHTRGQSPEEFLAAGFHEAELHAPHTDWVRNCVMMNWSVAHEFGLLTPENLELMRRGDPPQVTVGSFRGDAMEVVLLPLNDPHYETAAACPKLVPSRLAKSMQLAAQNEAQRGPAIAPQRTGPRPVPVVAAPQR